MNSLSKVCIGLCICMAPNITPQQSFWDNLVIPTGSSHYRLNSCDFGRAIKA